MTRPTSAYRSAAALLVLAASLAVPSVGAAANVLTVKHDTVLHMNGVEPSGSTTPVKVEHEPSFEAEPLFTGGAAHSKLVNLALNDEAKVSGTNMAVIVTSAKGGGTAIGVIYLDGSGQPIVGSYVVGISNHYVTIVKVTGPSKARTVYRHSAY